MLRPIEAGAAVIALLATQACGGPREAGRTTIAVIPKGTSHVFWQSIHAGAAKAAAEQKVDIVWRGPLREDDRDSQVSEVEGFVSRGVSGIVLAPLDESALAAPVANAVQHGIPVVIIDSGLKGEGYVSFVATDNRKGGRLAGEQFAKLLGGKGKVVLLRYTEGSDSTNNREEGFLETVKGSPGIQVLSSNQYGGADVEGAYKKGRRCSATTSSPTESSPSTASSVPTSRRASRCCACCRTTAGRARCGSSGSTAPTTSPRACATATSTR